MEVFVKLFTTPSVASSLLFLCLTAFTGILLGGISIKKIKLGVAGTLFTGILFSHFGAPIDEHILHFVREFGLILFVYGIGITMGPRFFSSFKKDGIVLNALAAGIALMGLGMALLVWKLTGLPSGVVIGILSGAVTNTPSLGAAQQVLIEQGGAMAGASTGMAYAVAYPFGILGIILTMIILRIVFRISINKEVQNYNESLSKESVQLESVEATVLNPSLVGKNIEYLKRITDKELAVSRVLRNGETLVATDDVEIKENDVICGVSTKDYLESLEVKIGRVKVVETPSEIQGPHAIINVLMTNKRLAGKTIEQVGIYRRYPANVTRIYRAGVKILPTHDTTLEMGDTVRVVGKREALSEIKKELGDSVHELAKPNIISIFVGIFLGLLVGSIPIFIPGLPAPAKLGLAGGPLIIAILLGYKGRIGKLSFYMTPGANYIIRELGIVMFLACVGLLSGEKFVETIVNGGWLWMLYGMAVTLVPILLTGIIARLMKINYLKICGMIAGSMTDPPALEFANDIAPGYAQANAYAMVYPLTMLLRILFAQIFVLMTI